MVHWIFILVGFAFGFFFGACSIMLIAKVARKFLEDIAFKK